MAWAEQPAFSDADSVEVAGTSYELTDLDAATWYYWRVRACDGSGCSGVWSAARSFTTGTSQVQRYYYLVDHMGSVRATINETGTVVHHDDYYPFGAPMPLRNYVAGEEGSPEGKPRYTGHEQEVDIDPDYKAVYYAGARYYDGLLLLRGAPDSPRPPVRR